MKLRPKTKIKMSSKTLIQRSRLKKASFRFKRLIRPKKKLRLLFRDISEEFRLGN